MAAQTVNVSTIDQDVFAFEEPDGIQCQLRILYRLGGPVYEVYRDGKILRERQPVPDDEDLIGCIQRIARETGGVNFRRR